MPVLLHCLDHCSNPLVGVGTICSDGLFCSVNFVQSIYSSYWVETGIIKKPVQRRVWIQKDFLIFRFLQEVIEVYSCVISSRNSVVLFTFSLCYKIVTIVNNDVIGFNFEDRGWLLIGFNQDFWLKSLANISNFNILKSKMAPNTAFYIILFKYVGNRDLKSADKFYETSKIAICTFL